MQGNDDYDPEASTYFLKSFVDLNSEMLAANARIDTPHHWQSSVAQWVVNGRGLLYWTHGDGKNSSQVCVWGARTLSMRRRR